MIPKIYREGNRERAKWRNITRILKHKYRRERKKLVENPNKHKNLHSCQTQSYAQPDIILSLSAEKKGAATVLT